MAFNFSKFNKSRTFIIDTSNFEYVSLETLYEDNGADYVYSLRGLYISNKSQYDPEAPVIATDSCYVNIPVHQLDEVKEMLNSPLAIKEINNGDAGFKIESYYQARFKKTCYVVRWGNFSDLAAEVVASDDIGPYDDEVPKLSH